MLKTSLPWLKKWLKQKNRYLPKGIEMNLTKLPAICLSVLTLFFGLIFPAFSQNNGISVTFKNNSNNTLKCWIFQQDDYVPFINLNGKQERHFENFNAGSNVRCAIDIDSNSSTVLTYFDVKTAGTHELLLDKVPCPSCREKGGKDWRWATIIVYPNGQADYNRLKS